MKKIMTVVVLLVFISVYLLSEKPLEFYPLNQIEYQEVVIDGAISIPGTYLLKEGQTLFDLVTVAGGFLPTANIMGLELNQQLTKRSYYIDFYIQGEVVDNLIELINLNQATSSELAMIPNMTVNRIEAFLIYRNQVGIIMNVEELLNVKGIGPATFEKIKPFITV